MNSDDMNDLKNMSVLSPKLFFLRGGLLICAFLTVFLIFTGASTVSAMPPVDWPMRQNIEKADEVTVKLSIQVKIDTGESISVLQKTKHKFYFSEMQQFIVLYVETSDGYLAVPASSIEWIRFTGKD